MLYNRKELSCEVDFWFWSNLKLWIFEKWKFQKRGGKGGADIHIWLEVAIMSKIQDFTSKVPFPASYDDILGRNRVSGMLPPPFYASPFAPPFIYTPLGWKIWKNHHFEENTHSSQAPRERCPPFCHPFWYICKVQEQSYIFCIYHFLIKCFVLAVDMYVHKTN